MSRTDGTALKGIFSLLRNERFSDLLVPGVVRTEDPDQHFQLLLDTVYLQAGGEGPYLRLSALDQGDQLGLSIVDGIEHDSMLVADEDVRAGVVSLAPIHFGEFETLRCESVRFLVDERSAVDDGVVKFAEFIFEGEQCVSFDPLWTFGIRIGSAGAAARYQKDRPGAFGYREEFRWTSDSADNME